MAPGRTTSRVEDGIAILTLDNPPFNALSPPVLKTLGEELKKAQNDPNVKAIIVTGANGRFCAGFDINEFAKAMSGDGPKNGLDQTVNDTLTRFMEEGPKPTVAAVAGVALGGGCEVACAANGRVGVRGVKIGLPELTLGILPGFGGTQRLPRLIGLQEGVTAILTSKPIKCERALELGFFDSLVGSEAELLPAAKKLALDLASGRKQRVYALRYDAKLPSDRAEAAALIDFAKEETAKRARNLEHPLLMLDAIKTGLLEGGHAGVAAETRAFERATHLPAHAALVHFFFASRATKKVAGVTDRGLKPRPVKLLAVVGGGLMGSGIATASILAGIPTILKEIDQRFLDAGVARVRANLASRVKKGRLSAAKAEQTLALLRPTLSYDGWRDVSLVIEAAVERLDLKQRIFRELRDATGPQTILATNTSTISILDVAAQIPEDVRRVIGAHFFSPAHVMPLLEIVVTPQTDPQVQLDVLAYGARIGKTPVVVGNCPGFAVNRVFFPYTQSAFVLVDGGADLYAIDRAIKDFGMPMGPFRLGDLVGNDVGFHIGKTYVEAFGDRVRRTELVPLLYENDLLGEKTGKGYYSYDAKRKATPNPGVLPLVERSRAAARFSPEIKAYVAKIAADPQKIVEFLFFPVVNEAARVIAEGIVDKPADLDAATILSMGFPPYRGGIVHWADHVGARKIRDTLDEYARVFKPAGLENIFKPSPFLDQVANKNGKLSAGAAQAKI